jgi:hypothetical protein
MDDQRTNRESGGTLRAATDEDDYTPRWSWPQFFVAVSLIPLGWLWSMVWLGIGFGGTDSWIYPIAEAAFMAGPWIMGAGAIWLAAQVIVGPLPMKKRFSLRTLLIVVTLIALALGTAAVM